MLALLKTLNIFVFIFSLLIAYHLSLVTIFAQDNSQQFTTNYETTYVVDDKGAASVTQQVTLINNTSKVYAESYDFIVEGKKPENIQATFLSNNLPLEITQDENKTKIHITFPEAVVGKNKSRVFTIKYLVNDIATPNGRVWEVAIPRLADPAQVDEQKLTLSVPVSFGNPAYISPLPKNKFITTNMQNFYFEKGDLIRAGVVAAFGQFQVYSFHLTYHLKNPNSGLGETDVALPPDTVYQRVYYESLIPEPKNIHLDVDGNWIATYRLNGHEELNVEAVVDVQIFSGQQDHFLQTNPKDADYYLNSTDKWQADDPEIQQLARNLKTPKNIYDFVVGKLNYDYNRVNENVERFGAKKALHNPDNAICTEFTDLFIALARAAGIPAREVNGYAYTENPKIQPLSLVADVLHAWPEYWDADKQIWQPIDPTWEDTTGGVDYFNKFDLSHVVFVIHGKNSTSPFPAGSYKTDSAPQKDVSVQFGQLPQIKNDDLEVQVLNPKVSIPFFTSHRTLHIFNPGPTATYNTVVNLSGSGLTLKNQKGTTIEFLAPFSSDDIPVQFTTNFIPTTNSANINIKVGDKEIIYKIPAEEIFLSKFFLVFGSILVVILVFLGTRYILLFRNGRKN